MTTNELIDRLIRIKDGMTQRENRDAINEACRILTDTVAIVNETQNDIDTIRKNHSEIIKGMEVMRKTYSEIIKVLDVMRKTKGEI